MIRFYNGEILRFGGGAHIGQGELWTEGDRIVHVGAAPAGEKPAFEREIDLQGNLLIPGFKNAHAHGAMTFARSFADDLPLQEWLYGKILPLENGLDDEAVYALAKLSHLESLSSGITSTFDMYYCRRAYAQSCVDSGFRSVICGAKSAFDSDWTDAERDFEEFNRFHPLVGYRYGIHAEYTANLDLIRYMRTLLEKYKAPFYAHNSETKSEVEECYARHGCSPTALFEREGLYEYGGGGFHCVWFDEGDMEIFARRGLYAVTCPGSNAKLASGVAPLVEMHRLGIPLAIGTDGPASNNALDMFREMYLACVLQKLRQGDAAAMDAAWVLEMACCGGAMAMGLEDCRELEVGMQADLAVIDLHQPNMQPVHNTVKNIVYSGSKSNVALTMVAGRVLFERGEFHLDESAEDIYAHARQAAGRLVGA